MSIAKNVFARLAKEFNKLAEEGQGEENKVELATMTLKDGTKIEAEAFEVGANIFIVNPEGDNIPAPVGEHYTQEGKLIIVAEEGIIAEVKDAEASEEVAEEVSEVEEEMAQEEDKFALMAEEINTLKAEIAAIKEAMGKKEEMAKEEEEVKMSAAPAAKPIKAAPKEEVAQVKFKIGSKGQESTKDRIFNKLFNN